MYLNNYLKDKFKIINLEDLMLLAFIILLFYLIFVVMINLFHHYIINSKNYNILLQYYLKFDRIIK